MNGLQVYLLGNVDIRYNGKSIAKNLSEKSIAIIAMLICAENRKMSRQKIASMLWADSFETANYNLRYNLWNIRKVIPRMGEHDFILADREFCRINPQYKFWCDIACLDSIGSDLDTHINHQIEYRELLKGGFLDQFYIKNSEEFNEWVELERVGYERVCIDLLKKIMEKDRCDGNTELIINDMLAILQLDPFNEELHYGLMKAYLKTGNRSRAIAQYKKYRKLLMDELQLEPKECIKELYSFLTKNASEDTEENEVVIIVNENPSPGVGYFAAGELVDRILWQLRDGYLVNVPTNYWRDICSIHPDVERFAARGKKGERVSDIRLFYSIRGMLMKLGEELDFRVIIKNTERIDEKSGELFGFLSNTTELNLQYED